MTYFAVMVTLFGAVKLGLEGERGGGCEKCVCPKNLQRGAGGGPEKSLGMKCKHIRRQGDSPK